jgi:hypothetical protein
MTMISDWQLGKVPCALLMSAAYAFVCITCMTWVPRAAASSSLDQTHRNSLVTGVSYVMDSEPSVFQRVRETGARFVQRTVEWGLVAPKNKPPLWNPEDPGDPHYEWAKIDAWIGNAVAWGLTPVLQIRGAPFWAQRCASTSIDSPCNPDPSALAAFAVAAAL